MASQSSLKTVPGTRIVFLKSLIDKNKLRHLNILDINFTGNKDFMFWQSLGIIINVGDNLEIFNQMLIVLMNFQF